MRSHHIQNVKLRFKMVYNIILSVNPANEIFSCRCIYVNIIGHYSTRELVKIVMFS